MEPKDLKNPEGLERTEKTGKTKTGKSAETKHQAGGNEKSEPDGQGDVSDVKAVAEGEKTAGEIADTEEKQPANAVSSEPVEPAQEKSDAATEAEPEAQEPGEPSEDKPEPEAEPEAEPGEPSEDKPEPGETSAEQPVSAVREDTVSEDEPSEVAPADEAPETPSGDEPQAGESSDVQAAEEVSPAATSEVSGTQDSASQTEGKSAPADNDREADKPAVQENAAPPVRKEHIKKEKIDYNTYSQIELVNALRKVLDTHGDEDVKEDVEAIKTAFYKQLKEEVEEQKKAFLEDGGFEEDFVEEENPYEPDIKELLKRYRQLRHEFNKKLDQEKEINLQVKYDIIEEIKGLIHKEESINKTFQEFRDLQQRWREIGLVPQSKMKDLWNTYHFHVENFYDYIKINKELRDLDLKKNLEMKIRLCEQAEELLLEPNIIKAFNQLQKLHERWREIGPVPRENKDDIWERFKASTAKINKKHQDYFEIRKTEQKENLEAKRALCEQVEEINQTELTTHKDWAEKSKEVINLQKVWRTIGFAPRKDNNKIYKRFREACDAFFDAKREFYSKNKELQQNNLQLKTELCMQAEALKDSTDWHKTTQDLINIQKQWKEIGPVPRKHSDALWKRFRAACDYFFDKKSDHFTHVDSEQLDNLKLKEEVIQDVQNYTASEDADQNLSALKDFQRRWTEIGHVPIRKKDEVQKQFREAIDKLFDDLNLDESKRNLLRFRTKIASISESSRGQNKMRMERDKYMTRLKQLESDLVLLDNNIGFFAKSKNAETLIRDVKKKIEQTREKIEMLKNKIRVIDEMDHSED